MPWLSHAPSSIEPKGTKFVPRFSRFQDAPWFDEASSSSGTMPPGFRYEANPSHRPAAQSSWRNGVR